MNLQQAKKFCQDHGIEVKGDKRMLKSFEDAISRAALRGTYPSTELACHINDNPNIQMLSALKGRCILPVWVSGSAEDFLNDTVDADHIWPDYDQEGENYTPPYFMVTEHSIWSELSTNKQSFRFPQPEDEEDEDYDGSDMEPGIVCRDGVCEVMQEFKQEDEMKNYLAMLLTDLVMEPMSDEQLEEAAQKIIGAAKGYFQLCIAIVLVFFIGCKKAANYVDRLLGGSTESIEGGLPKEGKDLSPQQLADWFKNSSLADLLGLQDDDL